MTFAAGVFAGVLLVAVVWVVVALVVFSPLKGEPLGHDHSR